MAWKIPQEVIVTGSPAFAVAPPTDHPDRWRTVRQFAYVDRAFRDVRRYLSAAPARIIEDPGHDGPARPGGPTTGLHVHRMGLDLVRDVRMTMGDLSVGVHSARAPVRWEDATRPGLFPILEATFDLAPVSAGRHPMTQLGLLGRYQPPLGFFGALGDTVAGRQVVLESVEGFLDELARRIERAIPASEPNNSVPVSSTTDGWCRVILPVDDLSRRAGGAAGLQKLLESQPGVIEAFVNPKTELAVIDYMIGSCSVSRLLKTIGGDET
jgi:hypothetical protein